jgi:hypothetical protein
MSLKDYIGGKTRTVREYLDNRSSTSLRCTSLEYVSSWREADDVTSWEYYTSCDA